MKKRVLALVLAMLMLLSITACGGAAETPAPAATEAATGGAAEPGTPAPGSAGKIAVIRNMQNSDHTAQFFAGCIAEGEALGYTVDTFMSDGDDVVMQDLMNQALQKDYDIWIVSHANEGYQFDLISQAVEKEPSTRRTREIKSLQPVLQTVFNHLRNSLPVHTSLVVQGSEHRGVCAIHIRLFHLCLPLKLAIGATMRHVTIPRKP